MAKKKEDSKNFAARMMPRNLTTNEEAAAAKLPTTVSSGPRLALDFGHIPCKDIIEYQQGKNKEFKD